MSLEKNRTICIRFLEEVWNKGNLDVADEVCATDFVYHDPSFPQYNTLEGFKQHITEGRTAYSDLNFTFEETIAERDRVVIPWTGRGTHVRWRRGGPSGTPGTGKQVTFTGITIVRVAAGKIAEAWTSWDALGNLQQIGVIPPLDEAAE